MTLSSRAGRFRRLFYLGLIVAASFVAVFVLVVTNTTMPLNDDIQSMTRQIQALKDENRLLEMQIFEETRLETVDMHAQQQDMGPPKEIYYFYVNKGYDAY